MGKAEDRAASWFGSHPPLGCSSGLADCSFAGTKENFENERQVSIQNCSAGTRGGLFGPSDKTRLNACQAEFDRLTTGIRYDSYAGAAAEKNLVISNIGKDNPILYLAGFMFVGLIIWLLMS